MLLLEDGIPLAYAPYGDNASYYHPPVERFERDRGAEGLGPDPVRAAHRRRRDQLHHAARAGRRRAATVAASFGNEDFREVHGRYGDTLGNTGFIAARHATRRPTARART
ncbi:MAG: hypothetical protein MZV70_33995 [Desulfobacterales bacterium]|nr:hypothetical protein [Desulfobacterales bacterium]